MLPNYGTITKCGHTIAVFCEIGEYDDKLNGMPAKVYLSFDGHELVHFPRRITHRMLPGSSKMWKDNSSGIMYESLIHLVDDSITPYSITYYL